MKCVAAATKVIFYPLLRLINFMNPEFTSNFEETFLGDLKSYKDVEK